MHGLERVHQALRVQGINKAIRMAQQTEARSEAGLGRVLQAASRHPTAGSLRAFEVPRNAWEATGDLIELLLRGDITPRKFAQIEREANTDQIVLRRCMVIEWNDPKPAAMNGEDSRDLKSLRYLLQPDCPGGFWLGFRTYGPTLGAFTLARQPANPLGLTFCQ
jgi:hypothetical protein